MPLTAGQAVARARELLEFRSREKRRLDRIREYLRDDPDRRLEGLPAGAPKEIHTLAPDLPGELPEVLVSSRVQCRCGGWGNATGWTPGRSACTAPPTGRRM